MIRPGAPPGGPRDPLDHVQTVEQARLTTYVGQVGREKMRQVCRALAIAVGCEGP